MYHKARPTALCPYHAQTRNLPVHHHLSPQHARPLRCNPDRSPDPQLSSAPIPGLSHTSSSAPALPFPRNLLPPLPQSFPPSALAWPPQLHSPPPARLPQIPSQRPCLRRSPTKPSQARHAPQQTRDKRKVRRPVGRAEVARSRPSTRQRAPCCRASSHRPVAHCRVAATRLRAGVRCLLACLLACLPACSFACVRVPRPRSLARSPAGHGGNSGTRTDTSRRDGSRSALPATLRRAALFARAGGSRFVLWVPCDARFALRFAGAVLRGGVADGPGRVWLAGVE